MKVKMFCLLFVLSIFINSNRGMAMTLSERDMICIDMDKYQTINFDSLVSDISCVGLGRNMFDGCIDMIRYGDYLYFMGYTIAGRTIVIYNTAGEFVEEITFSDALMVNSMCIVPELAELWVVSQFKIVNKFKLDGNPVSKASLPFPCANIIPVGEDDFLVYSGGACHERGSIDGHFMALTDFKSIQKLFVPMWGKRKWSFAPYNLYTVDKNKNIYIFPAQIDTIYSYDSQEKEIYPLYSLDFHGDFLTLDKYTEDDGEMHKIITQRKYIYSHYSFCEVSDKLFFKLEGKRKNFCMINLNSHTLYQFDRLFDNFQSCHINPFVGSDANNLYLLARKKELKNHYLNIKCSYPAIKKVLSSSSLDNNDWILLTINIKP